MRNSVVIPCYKSSESLPRIVPEIIDILRARGDVEIILVNDGSPDDGATWQAIKDLEKNFPGEVVGVDLALNFGEHHAVMAGLKESTGDFVVIMDDDGQNPPGEVPKLLDGFTEDIDVMYTRYSIKHHSFFRNIGSSFNSYIAGILMNKPAGLYLCSFKALNRKLVDRILNYPGSFPYIDGLVFRNTQRYGVVEVEHVSRNEGESGYNLQRLIRLNLNMAFGFTILPLRIVTMVGIISSVFSVIMVALFILEFLFFEQKPVAGWTSISILITFFSGIILFGIGILGEYSGRLYLTATGKTPFIVNEIRRSNAGRAATSGKIPFIDMSRQLQSIEEPIKEAIDRVLNSGHYILGKELSEFESELSVYLGGGHIIGVNSGTDAIILSLLALGVGNGDEVITSSTTAIPAACAITAVGAKPIFVDVDSTSWSVTKESIAAKISSSTKAILVPHLYGNPVSIDEINELTKEKNIYIIEDVAQSLGAELKDRKIGTGADLAVFSFYPTKTLGAIGDGGAVWTARKEIADKLKKLRNYGQEDRYHATLPAGRNSRLDEIQAAILRVKLTYLDSMNARRRELGKLYSDSLSGILTLPKPVDGASQVFHLFVGLLPKGVDRDTFIDEMAKEDISVLAHYPVPLHKQEAFRDESISLPVSEDICSRTISLPIYPELPNESAKKVIEALKSVLKKIKVS